MPRGSAFSAPGDSNPDSTSKGMKERNILKFGRGKKHRKKSRKMKGRY